MSVEQHLRVFGAKQGLSGAALDEAVTGWIQRSREPKPAPRRWTPAQWKSARDRRTLAAEATAERRATGNVFAAYPMDRWQHYNGEKARRCVAFNWPTKFFSNPQRCAGRQRKFSPYCSRHRALGVERANVQARLEALVAQPAAVEAALTRGEKLETTLQEPIVWRFELDPGALDNIGSSLHGGEIAREVLEQLPEDLGPLELAGYGRPWSSGNGLRWVEFSDDQATKAARKFARATSVPRRGEFDRLRLRAARQERPGRRRRRSPIEEEIAFDLDHWRDSL